MVGTSGIYSTVEPILPLLIILCPIGVCIREVTVYLFVIYTRTHTRVHAAFHDVEDSLASFGPGPGDFPSISNFDQSLLLPEFPTEHTDNPTPRLATIQESEVSVCVDIFFTAVHFEACSSFYSMLNSGYVGVGQSYTHYSFLALVQCYPRT